MDLVGQVHIFGLTNIHTFGPNISPSRLFSLMLDYAKPRLLALTVIIFLVREECLTYPKGKAVWRISRKTAF